jgi:hypothetical protein
MGFWMFGFLSVVLAVLKRTVAGYWSWWRVMLPFLAFLDHNAVYGLLRGHVGNRAESGAGTGEMLAFGERDRGELGDASAFRDGTNVNAALSMKKMRRSLQTVQEHSREGCKLAALLFFFLFLGQPVATRRRTRLEPADVSPRNGSVPVVISW